MHRAVSIALTLFAFQATLADERVFIPDQPFDMQHIKLDLDIDLPKERVEGVATLSMKALGPETMVELDAVNFEIRAVQGKRTADGPWQTWAHRYDQSKLGVFLPEGIKRGDPLWLQIRYVVEEPKSGLSFFSPEKNGSNAPLQVWSQGESIENRHWIPCFDHPNEMQSTEIIATVDAAYEVLSNGALLSRKKTEDGRVRFHWKQQKPHVVYLMTLVVGEFHVAEEGWRGIPVTYYVPKDRADEVTPTFRNTKPMLDLFTDKLGVPYPWEKYAQICCYNFGGGMENTSATTLGEASLIDEHTRMDRSPDGLIAHELAHQWFGDVVTCRDWAHLWINEGFASYFEVIWEEHVDGFDGMAYELMGKASSARNGGTDLPIVHTGYKHPDEQFDARAYPKGAWVVHMLRRELGDELFWKGLATFLEEYAHESVETADLRRTLERISKRSLERFFYDWTERPGHPIVELDYRWIAEDNLAEVTVRQVQKSEAFHFTLAIEMFGDEQEVHLQRRMTNKEETFLLPLPFRPERISVDPDMLVLMELDETKPRALWIAQALHDRNAALRIAAIRHLTDFIDAEIEAVFREQLQREPFWAVRRALANALADAAEDESREALLAALEDKDARVQAAAVDALGAAFDGKRVKQAIREILGNDQKSYQVRATAIDVASSWEDADLLQRLQPMLQVEDPRNTVRSAAVAALGVTEDADAFPLLLPYLGDEHGTRLRRRAVLSLRMLLEDVEYSDEMATQATGALTRCVDSGSNWLALPAARALGDLGPKATAALPTLRDMLADDPSERVANVLNETIAAITEETSDTKPDTGISADRLATLQEDLDKYRKLLDEMRALREADAARRAKMEARMRGLELLEQSRRKRGALRSGTKPETDND